MRLWHKELIPVLPRQQLLGQWRECCLIAKNIAEKGTPNHILVNKVAEYPTRHFIAYCELVFEECKKRGYRVRWRNLIRHFPDFSHTGRCDDDIFEGWHNYRYLRQCYFNLQEKYDCGGIRKSEWMDISLIVNEWKEVE